MLLGNQLQQSYAAVQSEANASVSSPIELIAMLHDRLLQEIDSLEFYISEKDFEKKAASAQKCIDILVALDSSLELESGEELILNIHALYEHAIAVIFEVSKEMDSEPLQDLRGVITDLKEGWEGVVINLNNE